MEYGKFYVLIIILFLLGCQPKQVEYSYNKAIEDFVKETNYQISLTHFPKNLPKEFVNFSAIPPSCFSDYPYTSTSGEIYLITKLITNDTKIDSLKSKALKIYDYYSNNNFIINIYNIDIKKTTDTFACLHKCNKYISGRYPIPCFELFDFGGKKLNNKKCKLSLSKVPGDLKVYVLRANNKIIWKEKCNKEKRPESLKQWKHGFSEGIAISEKEKILVYWGIVW